MSGVKSVSRHEEASGGGGSFAQQGGLIARQNLPSGWFCQDHRWSLKTESVLLIKQINGPT